MSDKKNTIVGFFDGASRGNPGQAGIGCLLQETNDGESGEVVWEYAAPVGICTNNEAEYNALICLLEKIHLKGLEGVVICGDSKLVVEQASGRWKVSSPRLEKFCKDAKHLIAKTGCSLQWIPREKNTLADALSNRALDKGAYEGPKREVTALGSEYFEFYNDDAFWETVGAEYVTDDVLLVNGATHNSEPSDIPGNATCVIVSGKVFDAGDKPLRFDLGTLFEKWKAFQRQTRMLVSIPSRKETEFMDFLEKIGGGVVK